MKKSNALMLAYMIFLAITLFANTVLKWNELNGIAIAATIAGCFFATADLYNWSTTLNNYFCDKFTTIYKFIADANKSEIRFLEEREKELNYIMKNATPYYDRDSRLAGVVDFAKETLQNDEMKKDDYKQTIKEIDELLRDVEKRRKRSKLLETVELIMMTLGFLSFFLIVVFDSFLCFINKYQSVATIIAFIVIMLNYYLKDVFEGKIKTEIDRVVERAERNNSRLKKINQEFSGVELSDRVDELIREIRGKDNTNNSKEDENNG